MCGLTALAVGSVGIPGLFASQAEAAARTINLSFEEVVVEMVDTTRVYHWVFKSGGAISHGFPSPVLVARTGADITINLTNNLDEAHAFQLAGTDIRTDSIPPGASTVLNFVAPAAGTYLYIDPLNAPVNRVMGLYGAFIVLPPGVRENTAVNTPYTPPTFKVQQLFNDLGNTPQFPGEPWVPLRPEDVSPNPDLPLAIERLLFRTRIWLFSQVDPDLNLQVRGLGPGQIFDAGAFRSAFEPEYFLLNGKAGFFAAHDHVSAVEGFIGEPHLIRLLNAGLATHSNHLHANHYYLLAINNVVQNSVASIDSMTLGTVENDAVGRGSLFFRGGSTQDWLIPFLRPPDIPGDPNTPLRDLIPEELATVLGNVLQSPLKYPMHDHMEQSQTAAGGNYPQGAITDIMFLGDIDKVPFPGSV
jgi:hypothetical protein